MDEFKVNKRAPKVEPAAPVPAVVDVKLPESIASGVVAARDAAIKDLQDLQDLAEGVDFRKTGADELAAKIVTSLRQALKIMEKKREDFKSPYLKTGQNIDSLFRPITQSANTIINGIRDRQRAHLRAAMEASSKAANEAAKVAVSITSTPEEKKFTQERAIQKAMAVAAPIRTNTGTARVVAFWTFEVETPAAVPAMFMKVDEEAIQRAVDSGVRVISGVKIFETVDVLYKANRRK